MPQHDRLPVRRSRFDDTRLDEPGTRWHRNHFDDEPAARQHTPGPPPLDDHPVAGGRWSTWDVGQHGPTPHPDWLVTELAAVDTELGVLKSGKEADVHLVERAVPGTSRSCLLAAKRYPQGPAFLARDVRIVTDWFPAHGLPREVVDAGVARLWISREWR